jgi:hypothetical protein
MSSSKVKISRSIHQAVQQLLASHVPEWREEHLSFYVYGDTKADQRFVTLKIEGASVKAVAKATNIIQEIAAGKLVENEGIPFWCASLASNGSTFHQLKGLAATYGAVLVRDKQRQQLRYFGPSDIYGRVKEAILTQTKLDAATFHLISLEDRQPTQAGHGAVNQVSDILEVNFVLAESSPSKILVTGRKDSDMIASNIVSAGLVDDSRTLGSLFLPTACVRFCRGLVEQVVRRSDADTAPNSVSASCSLYLWETWIGGYV